jgi:hypothetical protein
VVGVAFGDQVASLEKGLSVACGESFDAGNSEVVES